MNLRRFLNVAYVILIEEYQRLGVDLMTALEKLSEWGEDPNPDKQVPVAVTAAQNDQAAAQLQAMMSGVRGKPRV